MIHAGQPFEVQIRTQEMHRIAEQGVAAHWKYKDGRTETLPRGRPAHLLDAPTDRVGARKCRSLANFFRRLRVDLYPEEVYTFTPKGRVVVLPRGATPIDFAYAVHTEVGHQCTGRESEWRRWCRCGIALANGDVVEIVTQKGHDAFSRDWLAFVHTSRARSKIRQWITFA